MPIVFGPANPLGTSNVSYEYGKMQQEQKNAQMRLAGQEAAWNQQARSAQIAQQGEALALRRDEFEASQNPSNRDQWMAQQSAANQQNAAFQQTQGALAVQDAHLRNATIEQEQRYTQADQLRRQRLEAGRRAIMDDPTLTPEQRAEMLPYVNEQLGALEVKQRHTQMEQERQRTNIVMNRTAAGAVMAGRNSRLAAGERPQTYSEIDQQTGQMRHYHWSGNLQSGEWIESANSGNPPEGGAASGSGSRRGGGQMDYGRLVADAESEIRREGSGTNPNTASQALLNDPAAFRDEVVRRVRARQEIIETLQGENQAQREARPEGPIPFWNPNMARPEVGPNPERPTTTARSLNNTLARTIRNAELANDPQASRDFRSIAISLRDRNLTTGQLGPQQQERLQQIGYYDGQFTPEIDRQLSARRYGPVSERSRMSLADSLGASGFRQHVGVRDQSSLPPDPRTDQLRDLLSRYKTREAMPEQARRDFDITRRELAAAGILPGWQHWPPRPDQEMQDQPRTPPSNPLSGLNFLMEGRTGEAAY